MNPFNIAKSAASYATFAQRFSANTNEKTLLTLTLYKLL